MLGETQGTSAGGAEEAGKFLRVPGTNPFWPDDHDHQGNRFLELMGEHQLDVYLMNTGRVGGADDVEGSEKVRIKHSSAIVKAIAEGTIEWTEDPDFGYQVAKSVPGIEDDDAGPAAAELYETARPLRRVPARSSTRSSRERTEYLQEVPRAERRDRRRRLLDARSEVSSRPGVHCGGGPAVVVLDVRPAFRPIRGLTAPSRTLRPGPRLVQPATCAGRASVARSTASALPTSRVVVP